MTHTKPVNKLGCVSTEDRQQHLSYLRVALKVKSDTMTEQEVEPTHRIKVLVNLSGISTRHHMYELSLYLHKHPSGRSQGNVSLISALLTVGIA